MLMSDPPLRGTMKKYDWRVITMKRTVAVFLLIIALCTSVAVPGNIDTAQAAKINEKEMTMVARESKRLYVKGFAGEVSWKTSDKKVATVTKKGVVFAKRKGEATITAKNKKGKTFTCKVTVLSFISDESAEVSALIARNLSSRHSIHDVNSININFVKKGSFKITKFSNYNQNEYDYVYEYTGKDVKGKKVTAIGLLDSESGQGNGANSSFSEATKEFMSASVKYTFNAEELARVNELRSLMAEGKYSEPESSDLKLNYSTVALRKKKSVTLKVKNNSKKITWKSANTKIAKIDDAGKITAKSEGKTKITAKVDGVKLVCRVYVLPDYTDEEILIMERVGGWPSLMVYPSEFSVTAVKFGKYKPDSNYGEGTVFDDQPDYFFACVDTKGKSATGKTITESYYFGYTKSNNVIAWSGIEATGKTNRTCDKDFIKKFNTLIQSGALREYVG